MRGSTRSVMSVTPAASLHVHPNTFRYRLSKLKGMAALDLDDPNVRFRLMVHLRLRGPR